MVLQTQQSKGGVVAVEPGPTNTKTPVHHNGPVQMLCHKHTFAHSRVQQGSHTTMFLRAWCPGLYGASPAEGNHAAFLSELDERLHNSHSTLAAVQKRSRAIMREALKPKQYHLQQQQQQYQCQQLDPVHNQEHLWQKHIQHSQQSSPLQQQQQPHLLHDIWSQDQPCPRKQQDQPYQGFCQGMGSSPEEWQEEGLNQVHPDLMTAQLRRAVNASLATQIDFFNGCLARWARETRHPACQCIGCNCACACMHASLQGRALDGLYSCL